MVNLFKDGNFIKALARYYSEFLSTDFKKSSTPKRQFKLKDQNERRIGIRLQGFDTFSSRLRNKLNSELTNEIVFSIKPGLHKASLPNATQKFLEASIEKINCFEFQETSKIHIDNLIIAINKKDADVETLIDQFNERASKDFSNIVISPLLDILISELNKNTQNPSDAYVTIDSELIAIFSELISDQLPTAIATYIADDDSNEIFDLMGTIFSDSNVKDIVNRYFRDLFIRDLYTELKDILITQRQLDNLEAYLYVGEIRTKNNNFPIFYIPTSINQIENSIDISLDNRILINKKAIDYVSNLIQKESGQQIASPVSQRIIYTDNGDVFMEKFNQNIFEILLSFNLQGELNFNTANSKLATSIVSVNTNLNIALFDKADESMLSDYEELLDNLENNNADLFEYLTQLISSFLFENPISINEEIEDDWEDWDIPDRLVYDSPLPLAEEQKKILMALNNNKSKFVAVEGPPGTGKSHTISAIAFDSIMKGKKILFLSDTKEALDVVEDKINSTLLKVRPSEDFINPILRLGSNKTNYRKIISNKVLDNIKTQHREIKKHSNHMDKKYDHTYIGLKQNLEQSINFAQSINVEEIRNLHTDINSFVDEYDEYEDLVNCFYLNTPAVEKDIHLIEKVSNLRQRILSMPEEFRENIKYFGNDIEDVNSYLLFVKNLSEIKNIYKKVPFAINSNILCNPNFMADYLRRLTSAKGFFGYLFALDKVNLIINDFNNETGMQIPVSTNPKELFVKLNEVDKSIQEFNSAINNLPSFQQLNSMNKKNYLDLILTILNFTIDIVTINDFLSKLSYIKQYSDFSYEIDFHNFTDILFNNDSYDGLFFQLFASLQERQKIIKKKFQQNDFDYISDTKSLQNYNILKLANELDSRVIEFTENHRNDAKTLNEIIRQKKRFPKEMFDKLSMSFPCMICSLRDYSDYIPLERELFDVVIIDEASQVSIGQALPAIIRAKKMIVMGDKMQFSNVKTHNANKELNNTNFNSVLHHIKDINIPSSKEEMEIRVKNLNVSNSVLDFIETVTNFNITLKKHFRGYNEIISYSSKYFYDNSLQPMKLTTKGADEIIEFIKVKDAFNKRLNTNENEANKILELILKQLDEADFRSVAVITPHREQQTYISSVISSSDKYDEILNKLKFKCFTFDTCQGEERDIVYYSCVATKDSDKLNYVFPKDLHSTDEIEIDRKRRLQRLNVGFSRAKEKIIFIHSKPIEEYKSSFKHALLHYRSILNNKKDPTIDDIDSKSPMEEKVLEWLSSLTIRNKYKNKLFAQFKMGDFLKSIDKNYQHPSYVVDFLLIFYVDNIQYKIVIEYDGFEYHFQKHDEINAGNWEHYLKESDIERQNNIEEYGIKIIRLNRFNLGHDPIITLDEKIENALNGLRSEGLSIINNTVSDTRMAITGLEKGEMRVCKRCNQNKPISQFQIPGAKNLKIYCSECVPLTKRSKRKKY